MSFASTHRWPLRASEIALGSPQLLRSLIEHDGLAVECGWADPWPFAQASDNQVACALALTMAAFALVDHGAIRLAIEGDTIRAGAAAAPAVRERCGVVERSLLDKAGTPQPVAALFPTAKPSEWHSGAWRNQWHPRRGNVRDDLRLAIELCGLLVDLVAPAPPGVEVAPDDVLQMFLEQAVSFARAKGVP